MTVWMITASTASNVYEEMPSLSVERISQPGEKESTLLEIKTLFN